MPAQPVQPTVAPTAQISPAPVQPVAPAAAALPNVPPTWPGAWGLYKYSRQAIKRNWGVILGLYVLSYFISAVLGLALKGAGQIIGGLISLFLTAVTIKVTFASARGQKVSFGGALATVKPLTVLKLLVNYIFLGVTLGFSAILFIVPFVIIFPRVILAPYLLVDQDLGPLKAINTSWELTKGHSGKVWGIIGATIAMALLMITIIGIPFAIYFLFMYGAAYALLCEYLTGAIPAASPAMPMQPVSPSPAPQTPIAQ